MAKRRQTTRKPAVSKSATRKAAEAGAILKKQITSLRHELAEALDYQTAIGDVLNVISRSPNDLQPVLDTIVQTARRLCQSEYALMMQRVDNGIYRIAAHCNANQQLMDWMEDNPVTAGDGSGVGMVAAEKQTIHLRDVLSEPSFTDLRRQQQSKVRTMLGVPLLRDQEVIGVVFLVRTEVKPFSDKQVNLVSSFANQAVIAIDNARLFNEVQAKTRDLTESLHQQTATSEVLKVISSSPGELEPVFRSMLENAVSICDAKFGNLLLIDGDNARWEAGVGTPPKLVEYFTQARSFRPTPGSHLDRVMRTKQVSHTADDTAETVVGVSARLGGARSTVCVPMVKDEALVGAIFIYRTEVRPFTDKQIDLVKNFAAQAVIAIENTRLLNELRESLQQQIATADVLKVISASPGELEPVFQAMVENATRLCEAKFGNLFIREGDAFHIGAAHSPPSAYAELWRRGTTIVLRNNPGIPLARIVETKLVVHITDLTAEQSYIERNPTMVGLVEFAGARAFLSVPMLKDNEVIGAINIYRQEVRPFTDKQIELVQSFASQAVIAIENTRLLNELRQRTADLSKSLEDLRAAQDRLVQTEKLASLGQLTAGIAHEIKNPLNFVNNFSALSAELVDELNHTLKPAALQSKMRQEVDDLTEMLKGNLEKVVQHGKRADSIVKNMLLHSREGSGEHRPTDVNALLDESLNLAYHGARAEKSEFNINLQKDFDKKAGMIEVFPQEITRAFLNFISNGFYAAAKRKAENRNSGFEPTLRVTTRDMGQSVEIRIRDNGTGIPAEVKEKMFNPFFTTKPAGEGTGLGLSMSHDIIVKQHGGAIDVATEPGQFTEFTIVLPRSSNPQDSKRG